MTPSHGTYLSSNFFRISSPQNKLNCCYPTFVSPFSHLLLRLIIKITLLFLPGDDQILHAPWRFPTPPPVPPKFRCVSLTFNFGKAPNNKMYIFGRTFSPQGVRCTVFNKRGLPKTSHRFTHWTF